jgi:O-antigen/teichoic acid export membrane protein
MIRRFARLAVRGRLSSWPVVELMASIAAQLVLTPFLLHSLSTPQFGVWVIAQSALFAAATLSLGAGTALLPALSMARSQGDAGNAWLAIRMFLRRTAASSLVLLVLLSVATAWFGAPSWAPDPAPLRFLGLGTLTLVWLAATELDSGFSSALKALGQFSAAARLEVASRIVQVIMTITFIAQGDPAILPIGVAAAVTTARAALKFAMLRRLWPASRPGAGRDGSNDVSREIRSTGAWVWLGLMGGLAFNAFDQWFVGAWLGSSALAAYAVCSQIAQMPHAFVAAAGQTLVPWAAQQRGELADSTVRRNVREIMALSTAVAALPSLLLLLLLGPLLSLWVSPEFSREHLPLARGLVVVYLLLSLNVPSFFLLFGLGRVRDSTIIHGVAGAVLIGGCLLLPPSLAGFVAMKGLFAVLTLGLIGRFLTLSRAPR